MHYISISISMSMSMSIYTYTRTIRGRMSLTTVAGPFIGAQLLPKYPYLKYAYVHIIDPNIHTCNISNSMSMIYILAGHIIGHVR